MKKNVILSIALAMSLTILGGCSSDTSDNDSKKTDTTASASISDKAAEVVKGLSKDGTWIFCITKDVKVDEEVLVEGEFHDKGDSSKNVYRKLALYAQDADHNVTDEYTLTVKDMTVKTPNFKIVNGTVVGDIFVDAEGFELSKTKVDGNITFATEALKDSAKLTDGNVTGDISVK